MGIADDIPPDALEALQNLGDKDEIDNYADELGNLLEALGEGIKNSDGGGMRISPEEIEIPVGEPDDPEGKIWISE